MFIRSGEKSSGHAQITHFWGICCSHVPMVMVTVLMARLSYELPVAFYRKWIHVHGKKLSPSEKRSILIGKYWLTWGRVVCVWGEWDGWGEGVQIISFLVLEWILLKMALNTVKQTLSHESCLPLAENHKLYHHYVWECKCKYSPCHGVSVNFGLFISDFVFSFMEHGRTMGRATGNTTYFSCNTDLLFYVYSLL